MTSHLPRLPSSPHDHQHALRPYPDFDRRHPAGTAGEEISSHGRPRMRRTAPQCPPALQDSSEPERDLWLRQLLPSSRAQSVSLSSEWKVVREYQAYSGTPRRKADKPWERSQRILKPEQNEAAEQLNSAHLDPTLRESNGHAKFTLSHNLSDGRSRAF